MKTLIKNLIIPRLKAKPDFLIVGAQKSGTTSLYRYLSENPMILPNHSWKEVHYFNNIDNYIKGLGWYLNHFPYKYTKKGRLTFEATPEYLYFPDIARSIHKDLGVIKIISILRDPAERAYSAWHMYHSFKDNTHEHLRILFDPRTFPQAIEQELFSNSFPSNHPYHYIDRGKYVYQIRRYYRIFGNENVLVLNFSDLRRDLSHLLEKVCDFLGIIQFHPATVADLMTKKYNVGVYDHHTADKLNLNELRAFYNPYNQELFELIGKRYDWSG